MDKTFSCKRDEQVYFGFYTEKDMPYIYQMIPSMLGFLEGALTGHSFGAFCSAQGRIKVLFVFVGVR
jgi:hypothetical protein